MNKTCKTLLTLGLLAVAGSALGQNNTSPYSRYGLGELVSPGLAHQLSMGGLSIPLAYGNSLNVDNPASYSSLNRPTFDVEFGSRALTLTSEDGTSLETGGSAQLRNIAFGFPVSSRWGAGFGLGQFSTVGYDVSVVSNDSIAGEFTHRYHGDGGLHKAYFGTAFAIVDQDSTSLTLGVHAHYVFGTIDQFRRTEFPATEGFLNTRVQSSLIVNDFYFDGGIHYEGYVDAKRNIRFSAGARFSFPSDMVAKKELLVVSYEGGAFDTDNVKDTVESTGLVAGNIALPLRSGYGLSLDFSDRLMVGVQYDYQDWSRYEERFTDTVTNQLRSASSLSIGLRYRPKRDLSPQAKVWNRADYRAGVRMGRNYLQLDGIHLEERAISFGIGLPMARQTSKINFGIEIGERGTTTNNLLREQFTNVYIGLSLNPTGKWFDKRKYD